ncbi:putative dual-specificity kinase CMGC-DYRK-PRP4 family [Helianthus annuus]|uniref:Dual-specificity kinase CMGC-DYRK-PRP4 family n=2 Tax=Helianthus annuus TaxID=4232 RepID=A0A9K3HGC5_HELAN|nr:serine/threonine-protein kinase STE20 [Helianthus annuus]XP_021997705.1 serine/threonine-protein kinase STE20 [Helianthus annuus]KAF5777824.1 putative dual-specificity kinase CMGC-DYRK-PRP4 family [Helianthus annuus]KAJ0489306.1 putative dual-specificity kinase CMGC-DYRK-PRP4 family [Helianthus annuus]KAJ0505186.1 putative dual-specificity kinase CMGC-DYRK-PRP4 family [Helianthus annuus]KAJ0674869.1 putative dual-specificity kinase CMGC-DYRK-PRP4 family [Helianthus annuus]KAJ0862591.1 puta
MADSKVDAILEFLKKNKFARAEAALRSEIDNRPDLNGLMQDLNLKDKDLGSKLLEKVSTAGNQGKGSSTSDNIAKEKHIVKEIERGTGRNGPDSKFEITSFDGEYNSEQNGATSKNFMFSNGSEDNLLDLYTWRFDPSNGSADPSDNDDGIRTENVEYQISSQSKIHPSEASDTKVSLLGPVSNSNSKASLVPNIELKDLNSQRPTRTVMSKDDFAENPWSRNDEFCSVKTVFPFSEGDASTSYNITSLGTSEKEGGKRKTDNIRAAIKEQENEIGRALYFGKIQGNIEPQAFGGLSLPIVSENQKEELPRLPPVKLKSTEKLSSFAWDEKHEHDGPEQILTADNAYHIGSFLDVPIGQEISTSGLKRPVGGSWRSISQGITEDTSDLVSGFATVGDGLSGSMDYPHEYWDSDEYEDDDDVGYMRQPIEDETWFLAHEIDYPSDNEKVTIPDPQERTTNKTEDDDQSFAEEDSYLSGDQYFHLKNIDPVANSDERNTAVQYDGELIDEEELSLMSAEPVWQGFVKPTNELVMFNEPKPERSKDENQQSSVRSIGVGINTDVGDLGSEGDITDTEYVHNNDVTILPHGSDKKYLDSNKLTKTVNEGGFSFPPPRDGQVNKHSLPKSKSKSNNDSIIGDRNDDLLPPWRRKSNDSSTGKSSRDEEDETDVVGSETSGPTMSSTYGFAEQADKEEDEKVADPIEEDPGALLEDEEVVAVQEQVKQIKAQEEEYETFNLKIVHRKNRTGFEEDKNFHVVLNSVIAGRYHVTEYLGSAAFSKAIQAHDLHTGMDVCVKIIKNNKDFFDQSLDEIKLLKFVNKHDPGDKYHLLRLYDYFYYREHLLIVCELLKANLYEFHKFNRESGGEVYFTMPRLQSITIQCLEALQFLHGLGLIHCDLKPENILVKSYSRCEVKVIDLGSSCFETDHLCSYVQSRSYRAPEVILGLPYDKKIDIWSLGCILAELCTGNVLFQNDSPATLLARVIGIISPIGQDMLAKGRDTHKYFTKNHMLYERNQDTNRLEYLIPKKTSLRHRLPMGDQGFIDFVTHLLEINPTKRPSAAEALKHPWLSYPYEPISS